jgi:hypothetical protein
MNTPERRPATRPAPPPLPAETPIDSSTHARETGDAFLRAADAAIDRALSRNPEDFLRQNRQLGGQ